MNIQRNVTTYDAPIDRYGRVGGWVPAPGPYRPEFHNVRAHGYHGDTLLNATTPGKCLVSWLTWTGGMQPIFDGYLAAIEPIISGFTSGPVLNAEGAGGSAANMGRTYVGNMQTMLTEAKDEAGNVDASELLLAVMKLANAWSGGSKNGGQMVDALRRVKAARDTISTEVAALGFAGAGMGLQPEDVTGIMSMNKNTSQAIKNTDQANKQFWRERLGLTSDVVHPTAERDAQHAIRTATTEAERIRAMNVANRLHAAKCSKVHTGDVRPAQPTAPKSIAEINAENKRYWQDRGNI